MPRLRISYVRIALAAFVVSAAVAVLGLTVGGTSPVRAATFTVTNTDDAGAGSLRDAIDNANAAADADTITFDVSGTITLASNLPEIIHPLTIDAAGAGIVIDGGGVATVGLNVGLGVSFDPIVQFSVLGLTIQNIDGTGIAIQACDIDATIDGVTISDVANRGVNVDATTEVTPDCDNFLDEANSIAILNSSISASSDGIDIDFCVNFPGCTLNGSIGVDISANSLIEATTGGDGIDLRICHSSNFCDLIGPIDIGVGGNGNITGTATTASTCGSATTTTAESMTWRWMSPVTLVTSPATSTLPSTLRSARDPSRAARPTPRCRSGATPASSTAMEPKASSSKSRLRTASSR